MAVFQTYQMIGIERFGGQIIYSISPTEITFMSGIAKEKATNTSHQWQMRCFSDQIAANGSLRLTLLTEQCLQQLKKKTTLKFQQKVCKFLEQTKQLLQLVELTN